MRLCNTRKIIFRPTKYETYSIAKRQLRNIVTSETLEPPYRVYHFHELCLFVGVPLDILQFILDHHPSHLHLWDRKEDIIRLRSAFRTWSSVKQIVIIVPNQI